MSKDIFIPIKIVQDLKNYNVVLPYKKIYFKINIYMQLFRVRLFEFSSIYYKKKVLDSWKFLTSTFRQIYMCYKFHNTICLFSENVCLWVCVYVCDINFLDALYHLLHGTSNFSYALLYLVLISFASTPPNYRRCYATIFPISVIALL